MKPRIVVCGLGQTGYKIFKLLQQQGIPVVGIARESLVPRSGDEIIIGDSRDRETLLAAGIESAQTLVLAHADDAINLAVLTRARIINPDIKIVNRLLNQTLGDRLDQTLPKHVSMSVASLAAPSFTFAAQGDRALGHLHLFERTWPIREEVIHPNHPWLGKPLEELWDNPGRMLISYTSASGERKNLVAALVEKTPLQVGDRLAIGIRPHFKATRRSRWRKFFKALTNLPIFHHGRPVVAVILTLAITILLATLTYIAANLNTSFVDALYFTVGMITGAGGQEEVAEEAAASIKIFTALMMLIGAGIIGIGYALINDFILGSRLKQFWDAARVPTHDHYIVCGLGGIGSQIVQQLCLQGHDVVVIERDPNNRFLHAARSWGVPVIHEDASLPSTLKAAHLDRALALLTVTSNDMANLEIALTAKAMSSNLRAIARHRDPESAASVRQVFDFEMVLCPTEIATPSFAAAALGGKVLGNGLIDNLLWVALATQITPLHPFCDRSVQAAAMEIHFVPLYLETPRGIVRGWQLLETVLQPGDILYLAIAATELEQLWRGTLTHSSPLLHSHH